MAKQTAVGFVPTANSLRLDGLKEDVNMQQLFSLPKDFWLQEVSCLERSLQRARKDSLIPLWKQPFSPAPSLTNFFLCPQVEDIARYFNDQVGKDLPPAVKAELQALRERVSKM